MEKSDVLDGGVHAMPPSSVPIPHGGDLNRLRSFLVDHSGANGVSLGLAPSEPVVFFFREAAELLGLLAEGARLLARVDPLRVVVVGDPMVRPADVRKALEAARLSSHLIIQAVPMSLKISIQQGIDALRRSLVPLTRVVAVGAPHKMWRFCGMLRRELPRETEIAWAPVDYQLYGLLPQKLSTDSRSPTDRLLELFAGEVVELSRRLTTKDVVGAAIPSDVEACAQRHSPRGSESRPTLF